jgi:hypothetical protein
MEKQANPHPYIQAPTTARAAETQQQPELLLRKEGLDYCLNSYCYA